MARSTYRAGAGVAVLSAVLTLWTTVVRDDGTGVGYLMLILAAATGAYAAGFRAAGMARAFTGIAVMQAALGLLIATAPASAAMEGGVARALLFCAVFTGAWLVAAALFAHAARRGDGGR